MNNQGRIIGVMGMSGKIEDKNSKILGCMDPSGLVINSKNEAVGMQLPEGGIIDRDGRTVGWVMPDGSVSNAKNSSVGRVMPDGSVIDMNGNVIARVVPYNGFAMKNACESVGRILPDGRVVDKDFKRKAYIQMDNALADEQGAFLGRVAFGSRAISAKDVYLGQTASDGTLYSPAGKKEGCLRPDSLFVD